MGNTGIIGDLHAPFTHPLYLEFCQDVFRKERVNQTVLIGDIIDHHAISFWEHDPNGYSAGDEAAHAQPVVDRFHKAFPGSIVTEGNHDERNFRVARKAGLPDRYLKSHAQVWNTPKWKWTQEAVIDKVLYSHGTGCSGKNGAINYAIQRRKSVVIGHIHCWGGVQYHANDDSLIFGLNAGCGIDIRSYCFAYGRPFPIRPVLGCGVVKDGKAAQFHIMDISAKGKYARHRAGKRQPGTQ